MDPQLVNLYHNFHKDIATRTPSDSFLLPDPEISLSSFFTAQDMMHLDSHELLTQTMPISEPASAPHHRHVSSFHSFVSQDDATLRGDPTTGRWHLPPEGGVGMTSMYAS
jgi:hypothetical protein